MNHYPSGGYPDNFNSRAYSTVFGPDLSDAGSDALAAHAEVQAQIAVLIEKINAAEGVMLSERYEDLWAALEDAALKPAALEDMIYQEEADRAEDARLAWAERRYDERRDEGF